MKKFIILLDSRFRGNDGSYGFPLPACAGTDSAGMTDKMEQTKRKGHTIK
jgi:hypothetical protein